MDILNVARAWIFLMSSGLTFAECEHMKQVGVNARFVNESVLNQESLKDLSASGCHKLLKDKRVEECISLQYDAVNQRAPLIVPSRDRERFIHFSVYEPDNSLLLQAWESCYYMRYDERHHGLSLLQTETIMCA